MLLVISAGIAVITKQKSIDSFITNRWIWVLVESFFNFIDI